MKLEQSNFYFGTPFVGHVLTGIDYRFFDNFHLNASIGLGIRIMKIKYLKFEKGLDPYQLLDDVPIENFYFSMINFELGLSYAIPLKKKER